MQPTFPTPAPGASLILSFRLQAKSVLILGSGLLAAARAFSALEADASVIILAKGGLESACEELQYRAQSGQVSIQDIDSLLGSSKPASPDNVDNLDAYIRTLPRISLACITDTVLSLPPSQRRTYSSARNFYSLFNSHSIPVNTADFPDLCDFSFTSTHRFLDPETACKTALQVGVTSNGMGCRLAGRIRRDIVARLPKEVGSAVDRVGRLRMFAKTEDAAIFDDETGEGCSGVTTPNRPVPLRTHAEIETTHERAQRRMKWVAQISEYWPMERLARMTEDEMEELLSNGNRDECVSSLSTSTNEGTITSIHSLSISPRTRGKILLVGSGPGHPSLLTLATYRTLTQHAQLVLSDKLVPAAVLALIPKDVGVKIARKFPGNADGAQDEMMRDAVDAANRGLTVVRLKQGDPSVYARTGEEILHFRSHGYEPLIIPGVSSALAGPVFSGIPLTQRGVAESFIVCTGVGRKGKEVKLPGYERGRSLVVLMGVARLPQVLGSLTGDDPMRLKRDGPRYPLCTPIALIERASMPDQRVIEGTLQSIETALDSVGEQRPPGMLIIGWSCLALWGAGDVSVLDDGQEGERRDQERVVKWLGGERWRVREGLDAGWGDL